MKVFCVGWNKTGTTSVEHALRGFGLRMGDQPAAEMLLEDWARRDFRRVIELCRSADAFQDIPFSLPYTFQAVDAAFPGSKFILTMRDSPEQWYESLTRFHTKIVGKGRLPTAADLRAFSYRYPGFVWRYHELVHAADETTLYQRDRYITHYAVHNHQIIEYFRFRPGTLLVLNLKQTDAMQQLCAFLGIPYTGQQMPQLNKTDP